MTKVFLFMAVMFAMSVSAQDDRVVEEMTATYVKADPMTGSQGGNKWRSEHVGFTEWDNGLVGMGLFDPPHIFEEGRDFMGNRKPVNTCKVGLYSSDGTLIWLAEKWKVMPSEGGTILYFVKDVNGVMQETGKKYKSTPEELLNYMKEKGGYVRFIADIYGDYYFDASAKVKQ